MIIENFEFEDMKYVIRYPDGYEKGEKYPVIFFLHGAGTRGEDLENLRNNIFFKCIEKHEEFPFVVVAPLCSEETWFDVFETLKRFVKEVSVSEMCDKNRVYMMGASMGGYGTWQLAMSMPEVFAAIVPICGGGMYWNAGRLKNVPVWAFHGEKDRTVYVEESIKMVDAVNRCGGNAKMTIYPENGHDSWTDTYSNPDVFKWLLSNINANAKELVNEFEDGKIYG